MSVRCPHCASNNTELVAPGAILDSYRCAGCGRGFECVSSGSKRVAIVGLVSLCTGGLDGGLLGSLIGAIFCPSSDDDNSTLI
jgi:DNA-directed RNA polymerase subunit RPC12/RpoP